MKSYYKGSFTLEFSLIFMVIIFSVLFILSLGMYLYEMSQLEGLANIGIQESMNYIEGKKSVHSRLDSGLYYDEHFEEEVKAVIIKKIYEEREKNNISQQSSIQDIRVKVVCVDRLACKQIKLAIEKKPRRKAEKVLLNKFGAKMVIKREYYIWEKTDVIRNVQLLDQISDDIPVLKTYKKSYEEKVEQLIKNIESALDGVGK